jgi:DNA (cytosine-5)-methyltransferase 1
MEAASVAWHPLGFTPVGFSEIEAFPCAILSTRYPNTPNYGSLTEYKQWPIEPGAIDLLVGGTPCQSFSVAGLRKGLDDPRGNLALVFLGLADKLKPRWIVWENVPGVLSSNGGRDLGSFLGALVQLGYGFAMRVLDAQHFGVPQRRRRVFVVACLGDWRAPAEVLLESDCVRRDIKKGRAKGQGVAAGTEGGAGANGPVGVDFRHERFEKDGTVGTIQSKSTGGYSLNYAPGVAIPFRKSKRACSTTDNETWVEADASNTLNNFDLGDTRTTHAVVEPFAWTQNQREEVRILGDKTGALALPGTHQSNYIAEPQVYENHAQDSRVSGPLDVAPTVAAKFGTGGGNVPLVGAMAVRRLTPIECERLQGFPDNWSRISWKGRPEDQCPDGPRYKACGNSMAVPVMSWIGSRIAAVNSKL